MSIATRRQPGYPVSKTRRLRRIFKGFASTSNIGFSRDCTLAGIAVAGTHQGNDPRTNWPIRGRPHDVRLERRRTGGADGAGSETSTRI